MPPRAGVGSVSRFRVLLSYTDAAYEASPAMNACLLSSMYTYYICHPPSAKAVLHSVPG